LNRVFRNLLYNVYLYIPVILSLLNILDWLQITQRLGQPVENTYEECGYYNSASQYSSFFSPVQI